MVAKTLVAVLEWLRAGYPDGVPETDYLPLFALLRRQLCEEEVRTLARRLTAHHVESRDAGRRGPGEGIQGPSTVDIGVAVTKVTQELPSEDDIRRVADRLARVGFPVRGPGASRR